ncbi:hypothetical protein [Emticicia sp. C21]|uniref:hypothetical protein n=1 Tax=Emticicia sp. C21 TaxID=2302915 RepID=UPI000E34671D|nr:hypothetical protein [Emticicia sp. C21]RFS17468.1 hypothetical protein D0T08_06735 [Emticicia sp. C21]
MFKFKQIGLIFLSLALVVKSFVVPFICLDYEIRKDFIIKNYCVNKNKPELHCDGKCFLAKKINTQTEKEEQSALQNFIYKLIEVNTFESQSYFDFANVIEIKDFSVTNYPFTEKTTIDFSSSFFHPPSFQ